MRYYRLLMLTLLLLFLAACGDTPLPTSTSAPRTTPAPPPTATPTVVYPSPTPITVPPTFTPFRAPPTPTNTPFVPTAVPTATPAPSVPSLDSIVKARASFRSAYNAAVGRALDPDPELKLVLAQSSRLLPEQASWKLYFVKPSANKMYVVTYDTTQPGAIVDDRSKPILLDDAGQIDPARVLDSNQLAQRLVARGFPAATPIDTMILQIYRLPGKAPVPAWLFINTSYNRQLVVNAYTGDIIENSFNQ